MFFATPTSASRPLIFVGLASFALACGGPNLKGPYPESSMQDDAEDDWEDLCIDAPGMTGPDGMDITRVEVEAGSGGTDTVVRIFFKGDNETYMVENNLAAAGVSVGAQFTLDGGTLIDSYTTSGGGFKVSGGTADVSQDWTSEGMIMRLSYQGFGPSQVMSANFEAMRYDTSLGSFCDRVELSN